MQMIAATRIAPINAPATIPLSESGKKKRLLDFKKYYYSKIPWKLSGGPFSRKKALDSKNKKTDDSCISRREAKIL